MSHSPGSMASESQSFDDEHSRSPSPETVVGSDNESELEEGEIDEHPQTYEEDEVANDPDLKAVVGTVERAALFGELDRLIRDYGYIEGPLRDLGSQIRSIIIGMDTQVGTLRTVLQQYKTQAYRYQQGFAQSEAQRAEDTAGLERKNTTINYLFAELGKQQALVREKTAAISEQHAESQKLKSDMLGLLNERNELREKNADLITDSNERIEEMQHFSAEIEQVREDNYKQSEEILTLQNLKLLWENDSNSMRASREASMRREQASEERLKQAHVEINQLKEEKQNDAAQIAALQIQVMQLEAAKKILTLDVVTYKNRAATWDLLLDMRTEELANARHQYEALQRIKDADDEDIRTSNLLFHAEIEKLKKEVTSLEESNKSLEEELGENDAFEFERMDKITADLESILGGMHGGGSESVRSGSTSTGAYDTTQSQDATQPQDAPDAMDAEDSAATRGAIENRNARSNSFDSPIALPPSALGNRSRLGSSSREITEVRDALTSTESTHPRRVRSDSLDSLYDVAPPGTPRERSRVHSEPDAEDSQEIPDSYDGDDEDTYPSGFGDELHADDFLYSDEPSAQSAFTPTHYWRYDGARWVFHISPLNQSHEPQESHPVSPKRLPSFEADEVRPPKFQKLYHERSEVQCSFEQESQYVNGGQPIDEEEDQDMEIPDSGDEGEANEFPALDLPSPAESEFYNKPHASRPAPEVPAPHQPQPSRNSIQSHTIDGADGPEQSPYGFHTFSITPRLTAQERDYPVMRWRWDPVRERMVAVGMAQVETDDSGRE